MMNFELRTGQARCGWGGSSCDGMEWSVKEIAAMRFNSEFTISTHKKNIFSKLGVNNAHDATKYALRTGIIDLVDYYI